jgi:putative ABC transport system permease protein
MIYDISLAWRNLITHPVQTWIPATIMALAVGLAITVSALGDGVRQGIIRASDPFGVLVVGAKGSAQQLVLNTILLQGLPVGNIPVTIFEALRSDERVALAVPIALGDNVGGARIIGTDESLLELRTEVNAPPYFQIADGRWFTAEFEAVLGSKAAAQLGLTLGDQFQGAHGVEPGLASDIHEGAYTIVGVLRATGGPYDSAVFTSVETVWHVHEHEEGESGGVSAALTVETASASDQLTAALVKPSGFSQANQLWQEFYTGTEAQAAFPGQELGGLFDLLSQGERVLGIVGYLVLGIAALTVFLAMYSAITNREQNIAIMRSLGSSRMMIFRMVIAETLILVIIGALLGRAIGYGAALLIASVFSGQSSIPMPIRFLPQLEVLLWLLPLSVGLLAGLLPAARAYSVNVVENLFPT